MKALSALALSLYVCSAALAQTTALMPGPKFQGFDANGYPLAGGLVYTCAAGSTCPGTPLTTYTDATGSTANANPVVLDGGGFASIWLGASPYKIVVQNSAGVTVSSTDNVTAAAPAGYLAPYSGAVMRSQAAKNSDFINATDFGAHNDGVTDDTAAINLGLTAASGKRLAVAAANHQINGVVNVPAKTTLELGTGTYTLGPNAQFVLSGVDSKLVCPGGPENTVILVTPSYAITTGVINLTSGEPSGTIEGCQIQFQQPNDVATRTGQVQYAAAAVYAVNQPRFRLRHVKIVGAWNGVIMTGNSNCNIDDLQMSSFNVGISIDGAQDTVRINGLHWWPFGLTANQTTAFESPGNTGISSGRCDGLFIDGYLSLGYIALNLFNGSTGPTFGHVTNSGMDSFNGIVMNAGILQVAGTYFTLGCSTCNAVNMSGGELTMSASYIGISNGQSAFQVSGGLARIGDTWINSITASAALISVTGGSTDVGVSNCYISSNTQDVINVLGQNSSQLTVTGNHFLRASSIAYTQPTISLNGATSPGRAVIADNVSNDVGSGGSGTFVNIAANTWALVHDNLLLGWTIAGSGSQIFIHDNH